MSETAKLLDDSTDRLLARQLGDTPADRARQGLRQQLLAAWIDAGLQMALAPEDAGGLAASLAEASSIAYRWGHHAAPLPIVEMLLVGAVGHRPRVTTPFENLTIAAAPGLAATGSPLSLRFNRQTIEAPVIGDTRVVLAGARRDDGSTVLVSFDAASSRHFSALSGEPWVQLELQSAKVLDVVVLDRTKVDDLGTHGRLLTCAAMMGAIAKVLDIVIDHANTRVQFGRPLAKFQAIQYLIAEAASEHVVGQAALAGALAAFDDGRARPLLTNTAKVQAARAATAVSAAAHQVLGAIGFTQEHILHHYTKRLWGWRDEWGRQSACEREIGEAACADPAGLWSHLVDDAA